MGSTFSFEKLEVWQLARQLIKDVYPTIDTFPQKEKFNLVDQIRRAATSVVLNLAEMTSRSSLKEQAHFAEIAYGSAVEVYCALLLAYDLEYINEARLLELKEKINEITNKINALKNSQLKRLKQTTEQLSIKHLNK
ncbi:MAG: four helix bundle protein [Bacteroidales bacterium]|nr:four helix bundle protein [Bacteroidales bacterium]